jgi:hypothetical protein
MIIIKACPFKSERSLSSNKNELTIRVVIFPKKHSAEIPLNEMNVCFAMCEFAGHLILVGKKKEQHFFFIFLKLN